MPVLTDIPVEVFIDNLLPLIPIPDLLCLGCTNKFFANLCADDTFWKRKLKSDFNFSGEGTARTSGFKFIYRGLSKPRIFVWGERASGRLGSAKVPRLPLPHVSVPTELHIPGVRVVSLVAGGMSFHALDSEGNVYVWGTMDGTSFALSSDGFSESGKKSDIPLRLQLPAATRSISCGRLHSTSLDANNHIWTFLSFGRPFRLSSALLDNTSPDSSPLQIECGWSFSAVLTKSGDVLVWWPFDGQMGQVVSDKNREMDEEGSKKAPAHNGAIPCITWELPLNPTRLPSLPELPDIPSPNQGKETRLIQIAAFDRHIIGLTNKGHVIKYGSLANETTVTQGRWEYLPKFSEVEKVRQHATFSSDGGVDPPKTMHITHISAHFKHFIAYSTGASSIVLMGEMSTGSDDDATIIPALQHKSVISVVLGDYHYGALTSNGKLLTWGAYSSGALGLGDPTMLPAGAPGGFATENERLRAAERARGTPPDVQVPAEVRFDHVEKKPVDRFCFAATASGWHMGALVIDLEPRVDDNNETESASHPEVDDSHPNRSRVPLPRPPYFEHGPGEMPILPLSPGAGVFRVGYPGRGGSQQGPSHRPDPGEVPIPAQTGPSRFRPFHRIGFAGRGMSRGQLPTDQNES